MSRVAIWIANGVLFALCCFLVASLLNELAAEWLGADTKAGAIAAPAPRAPERSWQDRQVILERNLFNVSTLASVETTPVPEEELLEATKLPLELRGTVASENPALAWAAVEDTQSRRNLVVRVDDRLLDRARVLRIERRRIVLENGGRREELALAEEDGESAQQRQTGPRPLRQAQRRPRRRARNDSRVRQLAEDRFAVRRSDVQEAARNPAQLFSQARILPKYEGGQMVGVQLNAIKPGSLFEQIGLQDGDTITELNGIAVTSPQDSANLLRELTDADSFSVIVTRADGQEQTLNYEVGGE